MKVDELISFLNHKKIKSVSLLEQLKPTISNLDLYIFRSHDYIRFYKNETYQKSDSYLALWIKHEQDHFRMAFEVIKNESTCLTEFGARWYFNEDEALHLAIRALKIISDTDPCNIACVSEVFKILNL